MQFWDGLALFNLVWHENGALHHYANRTLWEEPGNGAELTWDSHGSCLQFRVIRPPDIDFKTWFEPDAALSRTSFSPGYRFP